jgi:hypothetical protein
MIPLVSISILITSALSFFSAALIWKKKGKDVLKTKFLNDLFFIYLISGVFFIIDSVPSFFTENGLLIQVLYIISDSFAALFVTFFIIKMPLSFFLKEKSRNLITFLFCSTVVFSIFYFFYNIVSLKPSRLLQIGPVGIWAESSDPLLLIIHGSLMIIGFLFIIFFFTKNGWFHKDNFIRERSRLMAIGCAILLIAVAFYYIAYVPNPTTENTSLEFLVYSGILSGLIFNLGYLVILKSVLLKNQDD